MINKLQKKKDEFKSLYQIDIRTLKTYKILNFIVDEIQHFQEIKLFSFKDQLITINEIFNTKIKYDSYIKFCRKLLNNSSTELTKTKKNTDKETVVNQGRKEEVVINKKPKKDHFKNVKKLNEED